MSWASPGRLAAFAMVAALASSGLAAGERAFVLGATTTTANSGLLDHLIARFTEASGIAVRVVVVGTGAALNLGRRGDVDVVLVHDRVSEEQFVAQGHGVARHQVMHNDFVIVGPVDDPAGIVGMKDAGAALAVVAEAEALFVSRGDDSGTHKAETRLWQAIGMAPPGASNDWYVASGSGMGATLNIAAARGAYTMTDRGTWLSFGNRSGLESLVEGDPRLVNPYGVILVDAARHGHVKSALGQRFIDWLLSDAGQAAINAYTIDGEQAFFAHARGGAH